MEQRQANAHAAWLNLEHPDRDYFEWVAMGQAPGKWAVVRRARRKAIKQKLAGPPVRAPGASSARPHL